MLLFGQRQKLLPVPLLLLVFGHGAGLTTD